MIPVLIGVTGVIYLLKKDAKNIENRCIKMGLTGIFLSASNHSGIDAYNRAILCSDCNINSFHDLTFDRSPCRLHICFPNNV